MGKKLLIILLSAVSFISFAQTRPGSLRGTIKDKKTGETIPFANVSIKDEGGAPVTGGSTDIEGNYNINPVSAGTYNVEVSFVGYKTISLRGVVITPNAPTFQNFELEESSSQLEDVEIVVQRYEPPLIDKSKTSTVTTGEQIKEMAVRDISSVASQAAGVTQDANGNINMRGGRDEGTVFFIDGVKVRGSLGIPQAAIAQTEVITGGLPAQYGDAVGGVISTTTRGPSSEYFGTAEILTSVPFDQQDYTLGAFTLGGPILKSKNGVPKIGFLLASEFQYAKDPSLQSVPYINLNEDTLKKLQQNPISISPSGTTVNYNSEYVTEASLSDAPIRKNNYDNALRLTGNLQFKTSRTTTLTVGGRWNYNNDIRSSYLDHIFNYDNNLKNIGSDVTGLIRFQQVFPDDPDDEGLIKNAFYSFQLDYTHNTSRIFDSRYEEDFFAYGHTGYYDIQSARAYVRGTEEVNGSNLEAYYFVGYQDTGINYTPGQYNPVRSNYVSEYFRLAESYNLPTSTIAQLQAQQVPVNGANPNSVYGLWSSQGSQQSFRSLGLSAANYYKDNQNQFRITASTSFDIKDHSLVMGFEYEQRVDRAWALDATDLWRKMRQLQNRPNSDLDLDNPIPKYDPLTGVFMDTVEYAYRYDSTLASQFAEQVRMANGLDPHSVERLNIDNMDPSLFSLDMFSADEIINPNGSRGLAYYGYDYQGNVLDYQPLTTDFFNEKDENGRYTRPVGAFRPIYIAGYVQDQFTFKDLIFNVGVRVDRLDLNQQVLKDPYILFPYYTVGELANSPIDQDNITIPANIGQDFAVYTNKTSTEIVGFRSGNQYYDASGAPITNTTELANAGGGSIQPFLKNPAQAEGEDKTLPAESFVDYQPQTVVMPRIAFNFPITEQALFIAHYDLLAQRPTTNLSRLDPFDYLDLLNERAPGVDQIASNPNLKPQKTTDYEVGFKQALTKKSAVKIAAFYRELRDLLQTVNYAEAYPRTYVAYGNRDFGTVKGFSLEYEMRRTNNIRLDANYTLQFANGTGSSATTGANLALAGQPNLRYLQPLDYDNRHQILVRIDYRYGSGADYNGPIWWDKRILENFGVNITCNALSGRPYTKRDRSYILTASSSTAQIEGQINGSRLPWQVTFDARINKVFNLNRKGNKNIDVYLQILNLLDAKNITNVYPYTGSASDDGYLVSVAGQAQAAGQTSTQSFIDFYNRRVNSPGNYALPRRIRLGIAYNF